MYGKIRDIIPFADRYIISLEVDSVDESWRDIDLSIEIEPRRKKRSLSANAYFHALCSQLAKALGCTITEIKNRLICDYGQYSFVERNNIIEIDTVFLRGDVNWLSMSELHLAPTDEFSKIDGKLYYKYFVMRGSHTLNSKEMAQLIEGTCNECRAVGVKTLDDYEIERMVKRWQPK